MKVLIATVAIVTVFVSHSILSTPVQSDSTETPMQHYVYTYSMENQVASLTVDIANTSSTIIAGAQIDTLLEANENVYAIGAEMQSYGLYAVLISPIKSSPDKASGWARDPFRRTY